MHEAGEAGYRFVLQSGKVTGAIFERG